MNPNTFPTTATSTHNNMDFVFPPMDDVATNPTTTAAPSVHNLLNASTAPAGSTLQWSTDLPSLNLTDPQSSFPPTAQDPNALARRAEPNKPTQLDDDPPIELEVVNQMGGLAYADHCKERAREKFKEMKKQEHMANGDYDRTKRRKKGDTSMTPRQKYVRRLRMNQDSAAAARYAQEVYVHVLEKLVKTSEQEKKGLLADLAQLRHHNTMLNGKVTELETTKTDLDSTNPNAKYVMKYVDMLFNPEPVSAHAQDPDLARQGVHFTPAL